MVVAFAVVEVWWTPNGTGSVIANDPYRINNHSRDL